MAPATTYDLRRRVLRAGHDHADVAFAGDEGPETFHLAQVDVEGRVAAIASAFPAPTEHHPGQRSWRLRGMAVEPELQGQGLGAILLDAVVQRARNLGAQVLWAAGRDDALGFYQRRGWVVKGEGYLAVGDLPHHTVVLDLVPEAGTGQESVGGDGPGSEPRPASRSLDAASDEQP